MLRACTHSPAVLLRLAALLALVVLATGPSTLATGQEATPGTGEIKILAPGEPYAHATQVEWTARHWQWPLSFPTEINPGGDPAGSMCGYGQSGPVFFLPSFAPIGEPLTCVVPAGTAIFVPIINGECSTVEPPPFFGRTEEELRACA